MRIRDLEMVRYKLTEPMTLDTTGKEVYVHTLVGGTKFPRRSVFDCPSPGIFFSGHDLVMLDPEGEPWDVVVATADVGEPRNSSLFVDPKHHVIGKRTHRRDVYEILGKDGPSQRLRFGETVNRRGGWSSWPPHSFDHKPELAPQFEEIFLYFTDPKDGYGIQMQDGYPYPVRTGEMKEILLGKHELVGGPDTKIMYVWAYLSPEDKEYAKWSEDLGGYK